jgi:hypothetical protein
MQLVDDRWTQQLGRTERKHRFAASRGVSGVLLSIGDRATPTKKNFTFDGADAFQTSLAPSSEVVLAKKAR